MNKRVMKIGGEVVAEYDTETGILRARQNRAASLLGADKFSKRLNSFMAKCGIDIREAEFCECGGNEIQFNTEAQYDELLTNKWTVWNAHTKELVDD